MSLPPVAASRLLGGATPRRVVMPRATRASPPPRLAGRIARLVIRLCSRAVRLPRRTAPFFPVRTINPISVRPVLVSRHDVLLYASLDPESLTPMPTFTCVNVVVALDFGELRLVDEDRAIADLGQIDHSGQQCR